jgi:HAD superfamily hydrolase (TIGR01509 family)
MLIPSLVLFDCDGVLVDSERLCHETFINLLVEHGVFLSLEQALDLFMGISSQRADEILVSLLGRPIPPKFNDVFTTRTFAAFKRELKPVAGVTDLLAALRLNFCVASNGSYRKMRFTLAHTGLLPYFEGRLFSAEDVTNPKPAPDLFLYAAQTLGVAASKCLVIEDSATGVTAAKAAGMRVFGYAAMGQEKKLQQAGADMVFKNMDDLKKLLLANRHHT